MKQHLFKHVQSLNSTDQSEKPRQPHSNAYGNKRHMLAHVEDTKIPKNRQPITNAETKTCQNKNQKPMFSHAPDKNFSPRFQSKKVGNLNPDLMKIDEHCKHAANFFLLVL